MQAKENTTEKLMHGKEVKGLPCWICYSSNGTKSACNAGEQGTIPELARSPEQENCIPTPIFLPGESHGQRSLVSSRSWGCKELDTIERLTVTDLTSEKATGLKSRKETMNPTPLLASLHQMWEQAQVGLTDAQPLPWGQV